MFYFVCIYNLYNSIFLLMCLCNKSHTIINKKSKSATKVWNYTIILLQRKSLRGELYIEFFKGKLYVCECVIWWNDCHGKLNLTLKEISKNEKIIINSLCIKEFYFFTKEFFFSKFLIILIVYDTYTIYIWDLHIWDDINTYFYPYYILWT